LAENEVLIKSKRRVQQHGEVFTPKEIVEAMVTLPGLHDSIIQYSTTVLEPSVGEGAFLINILERRLQLLASQFPEDLERFENFALFAISSLYGIELLEDNVKKCVINLYITFLEFYKNYAAKFNKTPKENVLESAKTIIAINIVQGDFLKRTKNDGRQIVFSEWTPVKLQKNTKHIKVERTDYTLQDIFHHIKIEPGTVYTPIPETKQLGLFDEQPEVLQLPVYRYLPVKIVDVYKQEMEEIDS
jgi:hypothetical protein